MPRKLEEVLTKGSLDPDKLWEPTPKNKIIRASIATNRLRIGGTGSSKSSDALMEVITEYLLRWEGCHALFLRKNLTDLKKSSILDLMEFLPPEIYSWHATNLTATFLNGSVLQFGHLANQKETDLQQYLSAAYPVIVMDECSMLSGDAYQFLQSRNRVNRECKPDANGEFPTPVMLTCTNPIGPHYAFYKTVFVDKKPWNPDPSAIRDPRNGSWWVKGIGGKLECIYDPREYDYIHSTILDNPHLMARDPDLYRKLMSLPPAKREKFLYGNLDAISGQYYDNFDHSKHTMTMERAKSDILWQPWQFRWSGWDWGRVHANVVTWITIAQVKTDFGDFKSKVVVYREHVTSGKDYKEVASSVAQLTKQGLPSPVSEITQNSRTVQAIYFSHEKMAKQMEAESPGMKLSRELTAWGLPPVRPATRDRVGRANFLYSLLATDGIVFLECCPEIIAAIPSLVRDEDNLEDVDKLPTKADDVYDALSYGLFGYLGNRPTPEEEQLKDKLAAIQDPFVKRVEQLRATWEKQAVQKEDERPDWMRDDPVKPTYDYW